MILNNWITVVRDAMAGTPMTIPTHIEIGTGTTPVTGSDTTLEVPVLRAACGPPGSVSTDIVSYTHTYAVGDANGNLITEVGAVNNAVGGTFANRKVFPGFNKTNQYQLRVSIFIKTENTEV